MNLAREAAGAPSLPAQPRATAAAPRLVRRIRVMLVEDSRPVREFLTHMIARDLRLEVVAAVDSGEWALHVLAQARPDVIAMDIRLPGMDGFETTRRVMAERPTPIVVVAGNVEGENLKISINALRAGALSVLEKPAGPGRETYEAFAKRLCTQLEIMSQVRVVTLRDRSRRTPCAAQPTPPAPRRCGADAYEVVGIVASTGGPNALVEILGALPQELPVPILVVQHITASFSKSFIEWLGETCHVRAAEARHGERPVPGRVYLPPADRHMILRSRQLRLDDGPPVALQRPSGSVLFRSMAEDLGAGALGVLLTGMGEDGAEGLLAIRAAGGHTLVEDESTAVVYGMPGAAVKLGAACESAPLQRIAARLRELVER